MLPLEGITIISIEQAVAAPFATRQLADLGARVVKIERPDVGDFAGDGKQVNLGLQNEREWARFCTLVLEQPEMATDPRFDSNARRVANREALHGSIDAVFSQLTIEQVVARLDRAQIANARMNSMQEFWDHPQLQARER